MVASSEDEETKGFKFR